MGRHDRSLGPARQRLPGFPRRAVPGRVAGPGGRRVGIDSVLAGGADVAHGSRFRRRCWVSREESAGSGSPCSRSASIWGESTGRSVVLSLPSGCSSSSGWSRDPHRASADRRRWPARPGLHDDPGPQRGCGSRRPPRRPPPRTADRPARLPADLRGSRTRDPRECSVAPPTDAEVAAAATRSGPSTVKVERSRLWRDLAGSGRVAAPGLVLTNAHVIAGVHDIVVEDTTGSSCRLLPCSSTRPWTFTVLRTHGLAGPPLPLAAAGRATECRRRGGGLPAGRWAHHDPRGGARDVLGTRA